MSVLECKNCLNIRIYFEYLYNFRYKYLFGHLFVSDLLYEYNRICVRVNLLVQIYLDNGYSFVSYFLRMSHSGMQAKSWARPTFCLHTVEAGPMGLPQLGFLSVQGNG